MNWKMTAISLVGVIILGVVINWLVSENKDLADKNNALTERLSSQRAVNNITIAAVAANHRVSLNNINAKQVEGTEHVKVKTVIKTVFKDSRCAAVPVPADAVSELQKYDAGIRARAGGSTSATTDR